MWVRGQPVLAPPPPPPACSLARSLARPQPRAERPPSSAAAPCRRRWPRTGPRAGREASATVAAAPSPAPLPDSCLLPDHSAPQPTSTHLAELGAQRLGLSRVWPRQAGPQLPDVTEAETSGGCGAAVLGGGVHGLQLRRWEAAWVAGRPWLSPAASGLGAYSPCPRPRLPEVSTWPGPAAPAARASRRAGRGRGCQPEQGSGCRCSRSPVRARPDSNTLSQHIPGSFPQRALGIPSRRPPRGGWRTAG